MWPLISPASGALSSFILALMSECPVFHMTGLAPAAVSAVGKHLRAFHIEDDRGARAEPPHRIAPEDDEKLIAVDDLAGLVHRPDPVGVAIECDAQLRAGPPHLRLQVPQVFRDGGIGMMVGEGAVGLAEQGRDLGAQAPERGDRDQAPHAVAAVHHHAHRALELVPADDPLAIALEHRAVGGFLARPDRQRSAMMISHSSRMSSP